MQFINQRFAVFGQPILHSKSPQIFNSAFSHLNIPGGYTRIRPEHVGNIPILIKSLNIAGSNITTPFKEDILFYLDSKSRDAQIINGVNTIVYKNDHLFGYNTDHVGVVNALLEGRCILKNSNCLVIGSGPAGRAAAYGLKQSGANVTIVNRTHAKAVQAAKTLDCKTDEIANMPSKLKNFDIIVSTLLPHANLLERKIINKNTVILDANYRPSAFSNMAKLQGCKIIPGERWLLFQAQAALELFINQSTPVHILDKTLNETLDSKNIRAIPSFIINDESNFKSIDIVIEQKNENKYNFNRILSEEIHVTF